MKRFLTTLWASAYETNSQNIIDLARRSGARSMCDLGCGDGQLTLRIANALGATSVEVVEAHQPFLESLASYGFAAHAGDLDRALPLPSDTFDLVVSNQVIEHLFDTDRFVSELYRVLKPGGTAIISTENAASWHNIGALILGWQPFSLTNVSSKSFALGNPFALHTGEPANNPLMHHHRVFALRGLRELVRMHGFTDIKARGAGYYPLPARFGNVDPSHAHFVTIVCRKPA